MKTGEDRFVAICAALWMLSACAMSDPVIEAGGPSEGRQAERGDDKPYPPELFQVEQIPSGDAPVGYSFADVEGDDPCLLEANRNRPQCNAEPGGLRDRQGARGHRDGRTALSELQAITPNVIDPTTFDADRAADEIGRPQGDPQSQIGMAVGADFLTPPPLPPEPELDETDADLSEELPVPHLPGRDGH